METPDALGIISAGSRAKGDVMGMQALYYSLCFPLPPAPISLREAAHRRVTTDPAFRPAAKGESQTSERLVERG